MILSRSYASIGALLALVLAVLIALVPAQAQPEFPPLSGRVVDAAELLSPEQEAALDARLAALEANSTRQLVVATIPDLAGYDIADYGYQLGRNWGIGQDGKGTGEPEKNNGVLLIIAPNDRKVRIEVGYGLEGIMTDALSSVIIQSQILPRFRDQDMPGGIAAGVDAIIAQLTLPEDEARAQAQQAADQANEGDGENWGMIIFWVAILLFFVIIPMFSEKKGKRHRGGIGPVIIWGGGSDSGSGWGSGSSGGSSWGGGGFSGGGGGFGGGGASGGW